MSAYDDMTREQKIATARQYKADGWKLEALADEFDVSESTIKKWLNPEYAARCNAKSAEWRRSPKGKALNKRWWERKKAAKSRGDQ